MSFLESLKTKRRLAVLWLAVFSGFAAVGAAGYAVGTYANTTIGLDEGCVLAQNEGAAEIYACENKVIIVLPVSAFDE